MKKAFSEVVLVERDTMIELMAALDTFSEQMKEHDDKYKDYEFIMELLGGERGNFKARVIIIKYEKA